MSSAFTNFLSGSTSGTIEGTPTLRDYQHATRLYADSSYARVPKYGFLYFVEINVNKEAIIDLQWAEQKKYLEVGLLAKKVDLPNFAISTDTLNQYNRKTVVQTKLTYNPVRIDLYDDTSDITHNLWVNYYKHYFADGNYGDPGVSKISGNNTPESFQDTKYGVTDYTYGIYHRPVVDFIKSINIYVLHQKKFTQYTLVNPKITEWRHDNVDIEGTKVLENKLTIAYETVLYKSGEIVAGKQPEGWTPIFYDNTPSPLVIGGNPRNTPAYTRQYSSFDDPGKARVFGKVGGSQPPSGAAAIAKILSDNYLNKKGLGKLGPVGYNIASGVLGGVLGSGAGKYSSAPPAQNQPGILNLPGGVGINIFKGLNTSVDGKIRANPAAIIFPKKN